MTAHGITRISLAKVSGRHLSAASNEPVTFAAIEAEAQADARAILRDFVMHAFKAEDGYARRNFERAEELQQRHNDRTLWVGGL